MNKNISIVFDMDGLLFDTERVADLAADWIGQRMGLGSTAYMNRLTLGLNAQMILATWKQHFGERFNADTFVRLRDEFLKQYYSTNKVPPKPGLYELLQWLHQNNIPMAVASSSKRSEVEFNLNNAGIIDYFSAIICGDMIKQSKPHPDIYLTACRALNAEPQNCFALEDSKNGLLSAHSAGCRTIMIPDLWQPDEQILSILYGRFNSLSDFLEWLIDKGYGNKL